VGFGVGREGDRDGARDGEREGAALDGLNVGDADCGDADGE